MKRGNFPVNDAIRQAISKVYDPCSVNAGFPINVIDMGLILGWAISSNGHVDIRMRLTSPGCTLAPSFMHRIEEAVRTVECVSSVVVSVDGLMLWSESDVDVQSRRNLNEIRMRSLAATGTKPQHWKTVRENFPRLARLEASLT